MKTIKKCLRPFNKKTLLHAGLGSKQQSFNNYQASYQKELCLLFKKLRPFFSQSKPSDRCEHPLPFVHFCSFFTEPLLPSTINILFECPPQIFFLV